MAPRFRCLLLALLVAAGGCKSAATEPSPNTQTLTVNGGSLTNLSFTSTTSGTYTATLTWQTASTTLELYQADTTCTGVSASGTPTGCQVQATAPTAAGTTRVLSSSITKDAQVRIVVVNRSAASESATLSFVVR